MTDTSEPRPPVVGVDGSPENLPDVDVRTEMVRDHPVPPPGPRSRVRALVVGSHGGHACPVHKA